jgi:hypothetical protein
MVPKHPEYIVLDELLLKEVCENLFVQKYLSKNPERNLLKHNEAYEFGKLCVRNFIYYAQIYGEYTYFVEDDFAFYGFMCLQNGTFIKDENIFKNKVLQLCSIIYSIRYKFENPIGLKDLHVFANWIASNCVIVCIENSKIFEENVEKQDYIIIESIKLGLILAKRSFSESISSLSDNLEQFHV